MADFRHPRAKFKKTNNNKTYMKKNKEWVFENFHSFFRGSFVSYYCI